MVLRILLRVLQVSITGLSPSSVGFPNTVNLPKKFLTLLRISDYVMKSFNTSATAVRTCNIDRGLGYFAFAHRYSQNRCLFLFLQVLRCFNSPGIALPHGSDQVTPAGLPHSEINGSMLVYSSPSLIAENHVLLRLSVPWHPPYALIHLTILLIFITKQLHVIYLKKYRVYFNPRPPIIIHTY